MTAAEERPLRFAPAKGARLAYQVFGSGPDWVVAVPPTAQNVELSWERPEIRAMLDRFGSFCRYLHFDKRGTGCSDRRSRVGDIDERVDDLRAVMDDAGIHRAHLFGNSEGGPMTLLFAATYPDRVASVILFGTGASLLPAGLDEEVLAAQRERNRAYAARWGTPESTTATRMAPSIVAADPGFTAWHQRYERLAASQDSMLDLLELAMCMDVREVLPDVAAPVLAIHRADDPVIPVARSREVIDGVARGRLFVQPGADHFSYAGDVDGWMDEFERWVTGEVRSDPVDASRRPRVTISTLGRFAVTVDGEEVPTSAWGSRRARTLCKRLVVARGWPVTRDELFDLLWPGEVERQRLGARLSVQLSTLRRVLHGGVIADRETVRLDTGEVATDLEAFHRATDDADVVDAYDGELLPDDRYEAWTESARAETRSRFAAAARRLAHQALEADDGVGAMALAHRLLEADAYDEDAHRTLVIALLRTGARREAEHAHDRWVAAMTEIGVAAPSLEALARD